MFADGYARRLHKEDDLVTAHVCVGEIPHGINWTIRVDRVWGVCSPFAMPRKICFWKVFERFGMKSEFEAHYLTLHLSSICSSLCESAVYASRLPRVSE